MKKHILFLVAALMLSAGTLSAANSAETLALKTKPVNNKTKKSVRKAAESEESSIVFTYCQGFEMTLGMGESGVTLGAAMEIPKGTAQAWAGSKLTTVNIGLGATSNRNVTIFLKNDLEGEAFYTQTVLMNPNDWNEVELDTPYTLTGERFFIGYSVRTRSVTDYPIGVDYYPTTNTYGDYLCYEGLWQHIGSMFGSVSIEAKFTGKSFPQNNVVVTSLEVPYMTAPGEEFAATASIMNLGTQAVSSVSASAKVGNKEFSNISATMTTSQINTGESATITVEGLLADEPGIVEVSLSIDNVNGSSNENANGGAYSTSIVCASSGYDRKVVVEEWTGTWCGWCVRGIEAMRYMEENYGEEGFIGIGVHYNDEMQVSSYVPVLAEYNPDGYFPGSIINRMVDAEPDTSELSYYYAQERAKPAIAKVDLTATYEGETPSSINVEATSTFVFDIEDAEYSLAFVITENNVGPYYQYNYYSGGDYGPMGGWENEPMRVRTYFNEVARNIFGAFGISNSVPSTIAAETEYTYSTELSTSNIVDIKKCTVIALLLNTSTGVIENAAKVSLDPDGAGVKDVAADRGAVNVKAVSGGVEIEGDHDSYSVYAIDGSIAAAGNSENFVSLPAGIYIVKANSASTTTTQKVSVK